eukprot:Awhi_evm1s13536
MVKYFKAAYVVDEELEHDSADKQKALTYVDVLTKIESLSHSMFTYFAKFKGFQKAENIEEELVHMISGLNDNADHDDVNFDAKATEKKLRDILKHLKTNLTPHANENMKLLFVGYIEGTLNVVAHEIDSYKDITYLQTSRFLSAISDLLLE